MCNNNDNRSGCNSCIAEILKVILILQQNACPENCLDSCDRPMLGGGSNCIVCNTRPVMLYTCGSNGIPWSMPTSKDNTNCALDADASALNGCSSVFRVEKLEDCCVTCRVLAPNPDRSCMSPYVATNSFFTMDLNCCCCIRCLNDTFVECV